MIIQNMFQKLQLQILICYLLFTFVTIFFSSTFACAVNKAAKSDPYEATTFSDLVSAHGYLLEEYHVLTADG